MDPKSNQPAQNDSVLNAMLRAHKNHDIMTFAIESCCKLIDNNTQAKELFDAAPPTSIIIYFADLNIYGILGEDFEANTDITDIRFDTTCCEDDCPDEDSTGVLGIMRCRVVTRYPSKMNRLYEYCHDDCSSFIGYDKFTRIVQMMQSMPNGAPNDAELADREIRHLQERLQHYKKQNEQMRNLQTRGLPQIIWFVEKVPNYNDEYYICIGTTPDNANPTPILRRKSQWGDDLQVVYAQQIPKDAKFTSKMKRQFATMLQEVELYPCNGGLNEWITVPRDTLVQMITYVMGATGEVMGAAVEDIDAKSTK